MGRKVIFILLIVSWLNQAVRSVKLTVACGTRYVEEGNSLECDCQAHFNNGTRPADLTVLWSGRSNNRRLTVLNVTRADNGTVFTCLMSGGGHTSTANYTLQVAYGPDNHNTAIYAPEVFITDGEKDINLTCEATEVNPRPLYSWDGIKCRNNDTNDGFCVVNPKPPWDDGAEILCSARSSASASIVAEKRYKLNLLYPPLTPPEIQGYKEGQVLSNGDKLHCRVSEGKPLVKKVNFWCSSDPPHEDQEDTTDDKSVQSSVTIGSVETETYRMVCDCSAIWEPNEDFYLQISSITVFVDKREREGTSLEKLKIGLGVVLPVVFSVAIIVSIAAAVQVKRKKNRKELAKTSESCQQSDGFCQTSQIPCPDYEEDEVQLECEAGSVYESSSQMLSDVKSDSFSSEDVTVIKEYEMSRTQEIFPFCQTGLNSQKRTEEYLLPNLGISPGRTPQVLADTDDGLYTEIDLSGQEHSVTDSHSNDFTTAITATNTWSSPRTRVRKVPETYDNVVFSQVSNSSSSLHMPEKEEWELYDTLYRH